MPPIVDLYISPKEILLFALFSCYDLRTVPQ